MPIMTSDKELVLCRELARLPDRFFARLPSWVWDLAFAIMLGVASEDEICRLWEERIIL